MPATQETAISPDKPDEEGFENKGVEPGAVPLGSVPVVPGQHVWQAQGIALAAQSAREPSLAPAGMQQTHSERPVCGQGPAVGQDSAWSHSMPIPELGKAWILGGLDVQWLVRAVTGHACAARSLSVVRELDTPNLHLPRCFELTAADSHKSISVEALEMEAGVRLSKAAATDEVAASRQDVFAAAEPPALGDNLSSKFKYIIYAFADCLQGAYVLVNQPCDTSSTVPGKMLLPWPGSCATCHPENVGAPAGCVATPGGEKETQPCGCILLGCGPRL